MSARQQPTLLVTRTELTALTALQPHQLTRREADHRLTLVTQDGRTGYPWEQVERLILRALPITGPRIARAVHAMDHHDARRTITDTVRASHASGSGMGLKEGQ